MVHAGAFGDRANMVAALVGGCRRDSKMTQVALAKALGVRQGNVSKAERGRRDVGGRLAQRLAGFFRLS
ncbi:MAG: XRE family transcriptional regulator, partial [Deltaproteobacteria bacterium]